MSPSRTCNCGWEDRTNNKGKVCPYCKLNNSVPSLTPANNAAPTLPGLVKSTCPECRREHSVNPSNYPYGMNSKGVLCPTCVFKIED